MNRYQIRFARDVYNGEGKCVDAQIAYWLNEAAKFRAANARLGARAWPYSKDYLYYCISQCRRLRAMKRDFLAFEALDKLFYASLVAYAKIPKEAESARKIAENALVATNEEISNLINTWAEVKTWKEWGHKNFEKQYRSNR